MVLLLDDVLAGLDNETEELLFSRVFGAGGLLRNLGATVILVTNLGKLTRIKDHHWLVLTVTSSPVLSCRSYHCSGQHRMHCRARLLHYLARSSKLSHGPSRRGRTVTKQDSRHCIRTRHNVTCFAHRGARVRDRQAPRRHNTLSLLHQSCRLDQYRRLYIPLHDLCIFYYISTHVSPPLEQSLKE